MRIDILKHEYWWGGRVHDGVNMPFDKDSNYTMDLRESTANQSAPLFLSSKGRYIYSEQAFCIRFRNGVIETDGGELYEGFGNLKGAYLAAKEHCFSFDGRMPDSLFFTKPQFNTWIALNHNQTQEGILKYAKEIERLGLPKGILMIDSCWERFFGDLDFDRGRFPDPKAMVADLHVMGYKVMLWVSPCVSPDSFVFRSLRNTDILLHDKSGDIAIRKWWDGYSAVFDMTCPSAQKYFEQKLNILMQKYRVDGFKFDAGDSYFYRSDDAAFVPSSPQEQSQAFSVFAEKYSFNELRISWKNGGKPLVMRLSDKMHTWDGYGLNMVVPNMLLCGLLGYPYCCPDMIGGGEYMQFNSCADSLDSELFVRYAQASALLPMMQFSALPSCLKNMAAQEYIKHAAVLHERFGKYILETAKQAAQSGEPIARHLAYEFPDEGFEQVKDMFMLGSKFLVAPILIKGTTNKKIRLPQGEWKAAHDEKVYHGGCLCEIAASLDTLPYFEKMD